MKLAIIGYSGCGKSTLARHLSELYHLPLLYLDQVHWLPGWQERPRAQERRIVEQFLDGHNSWVIDGNYAGLSYDRRLMEADRILFLNFNRFSCLFRAVRRYHQNKGSSRESITSGCSEKMDFEFFRWLLFDGRCKEQKERYQTVLKHYPEKSIVIKNQRQLTRFYQQPLL